jgi:hypothetical protein
MNTRVSPGMTALEPKRYFQLWRKLLKKLADSTNVRRERAVTTFGGLAVIFRKAQLKNWTNLPQTRGAQSRLHNDQGQTHSNLNNDVRFLDCSVRRCIWFVSWCAVWPVGPT